MSSMDVFFYTFFLFHSNFLLLDSYCFFVSALSRRWSALQWNRGPAINKNFQVICCLWSLLPYTCGCSSPSLNLKISSVRRPVFCAELLHCCLFVPSGTCSYIVIYSTSSPLPGLCPHINYNGYPGIWLLIKEYSDIWETHLHDQAFWYHKQVHQ